MGTLLSVIAFFILFGAMFGLPVLTTVLFVRHREGRLQSVLKEIKAEYRLRGRGRAQLLGRMLGRPLRITRDMRRGVVVSVDLLPPDVRRRHAQWSRERAQGFAGTFRRLLVRSGFHHAEEGERVEGRWNFGLGAYPTTDAIESAIAAIRSGLEDEKRLAEIAAAAQEVDQTEARETLTALAASTEEPAWLREEAYLALIGETADPERLASYGTALSDSPHATLRKLSPVAWEKVPGETASDSIRALLGDAAPGVVEAAARTLAVRTKRDDRAAEELLIERLKKESGPLLFVIVRALGAVGSSRAVAEMGRWCEISQASLQMREAVWRESTKIRSALGLNRTRNGGQLSLPPAGGELSPVGDGDPSSHG